MSISPDRPLLARLPVVALLVGAVVGGCVDHDADRTEAPQRTPPDPLPAAAHEDRFANWETPHVHPIDVTPDGRRLLVCNTAAHTLDVFDVAGGDAPRWLGAIATGLDPVTVRARSDAEAWVVCHLSDSVCVVDLDALEVKAVVATADEPADVVFAGPGGRAFVSCSQVNTLLVLDPDDLDAAPVEIAIGAEDPRALAVSADGTEVYAAVFESGNGTTILAGGKLSGEILIPNVVDDPLGPYGGLNPPPNAAGGTFEPPKSPSNGLPPPTGIIVRKQPGGAWRDDNGTNWRSVVTGTDARRSGRVRGWDLPDRDVAVIDTTTLDVRYVRRCMNMCMALAVHPQTGAITVVGTEALNEVRFEPNLNGHFCRVHAATFDRVSNLPQSIDDLNPHLDYTVPTLPQAERDRSIGDPRAIAWDPAGDRAFIVGMGSNNVIVVDADMARLGRVDVGEGPTGIALAPDRPRAFVLNRFDGSVSTIDTGALVELGRVPMFDPTPAAIRAGRPFLYDTHRTSGLGHVSCASCHVDARMDRLAWDLGDPGGRLQAVDGNCFTPAIDCEPYHPMKGPMLTQTLQDIVGKEPFHWRGDRAGLEAFNPAFENLLGDDEPLADDEMQAFEDFLATIRFPPNPFRNLDNSLPTSLSLDGHFFVQDGTPLPPGDAVRGLSIFTASCTACHTLPTGLGTMQDGGEPIPPGPNGEEHLALTSDFGFANVTMKIPQLRNIHERLGMDFSQQKNRAGFGFGHDGANDTVARLRDNVDDAKDLLAFFMCFCGSDLPETDLVGPASNDSHAAVGKQVAFAPHGDDATLASLLEFAQAGRVELIAKQGPRGWVFDRELDGFFSDRNGETATPAELRARATAEAPLVYTVVPNGEGRRLGIDADLDGYGDTTEREFESDPRDAEDKPEAGS